jgi:hypothetical protein
MDPMEFKAYLEGGNAKFGDVRDNPNRGKTFWLNHKDSTNRDRVKFTCYTRARVTQKPAQPTNQDGVPDPTASHVRLMEVEFGADDDALKALGALDTILEKFSSTDVQKAVKGYKYNTDMHRRATFGNRLKAKFSLTGVDQIDINKSISETEITRAYVDDIEIGDIVDLEIACLGGMLIQKIPSLMMRFTSILILEKQQRKDAFARRQLKRVEPTPDIALPEEGSEVDGKRARVEVVP